MPSINALYRGDQDTFLSPERLWWPTLLPFYASGMWPLLFICLSGFCVSLTLVFVTSFGLAKKTLSNGGFSVVSISLKVKALIIQWIRRLVASPGAWVSLLTY